MNNRLEAAVQEFKRLRYSGTPKQKALAQTAVTKGVSVNELEEALKTQEEKGHELLRALQS